MRPSLSTRQSLDSLAQSVLSGPRHPSSSLHSRPPKQAKQAPAQARQGHMTRDSLAHISINLPEAPSAFRHLPLDPSGLSQLHRRTDRQTGGGNEGLAGLAGLPIGSTKHERGERQSTRLIGQTSFRKGSNCCTSIVLPESPKRAVIRKLSTTAQASGINQPGDHANPNAEARAGAARLFGSASLDAGPPRLASSTPKMAYSSQSDAAHAAETHADSRSGLNSRSGVMNADSASAAAAGAVAFPLRQSDFSR